MLKPKQELVMEVLTARYRLGEGFWTFRSRHGKTLRQLEELGLVQLMHGIVDDTVRASLTTKGEAMFVSRNYTPPTERRAE
jgi:hypothetical protein